MNGNLSFWKKVGIVSGAIGSVLIVMMTWQSLEFLPRWAWYTEVVAVQDFSEGTRLLVLGQEWERLDQQIRRLEEKSKLTEAERELLSKKRLRMKEVDQQLLDLR
ncbi:MAG: hypothetical protein KAJ19_18660 [Gammaproteobacteria bacterium]|nr:hypothetical protein [Gammaproteobacteria bacterium]